MQTEHPSHRPCRRLQELREPRVSFANPEIRSELGYHQRQQKKRVLQTQGFPSGSHRMRAAEKSQKDQSK